MFKGEGRGKTIIVCDDRRAGMGGRVLASDDVRHATVARDRRQTDRNRLRSACPPLVPPPRHDDLMPTATDGRPPARRLPPNRFLCFFFF